MQYYANLKKTITCIYVIYQVNYTETKLPSFRLKIYKINIPSLILCLEKEAPISSCQEEMTKKWAIYSIAC